MREYVRFSLLRSDRLNEAIEAKEALRDVVKVAAGAGAIALTGGMAGDTAVDIMFAMDSAAEVLSSVEEASAGAGELGAAISAAMSTNISSGPDAVYDSVLEVAKSASSAGAEEALDGAKGQVDALITKLAGSIGEWVSTALPDDAGLGGIAIREAVESAIGVAGEDAFDLVKSAFDALPAEAQSFIANPAAFESFMNDILDTIVEALQNYAKSSETGEESEGVMATVASAATAAVTSAAQPGGIVLDMATAKILPKAISYLDTEVRSQIPVASKILNTLVTVAFGAVAVLQIIEREEYKDPEQEDKKEAQQSTDVAANENLNRLRLIIRNELSQELV